jgi:hypothetical protein
MTVQELIDILKGVNPEATVITSSNNFEHNFAYIEVSHVLETHTSKAVEKKITDAFDGTVYSKEVYEPFGGDQKAIIIS